MTNEKTISKESLITQFTLELNDLVTQEEKMELLISYIEKLQLEASKYLPNDISLTTYGIRYIEESFIEEFHLDENYNHIETISNEMLIENIILCLETFETEELNELPNPDKVLLEIISKLLK